MLKTRTWVLIVAIAAVVLAAAAYFTLTARGEGRTVQVLQDSEVVREIDLSQVTERYTFTLTAPDGGTNTVEVQPGRIRVLDADCPDRICVEHGWLTDQAAPIVCMPHRLIIQLKEAPGTDAVSR